jgi:hypothetical protein
VSLWACAGVVGQTPSNLRRSWKLYEALQAEVDSARIDDVTVDPAVYHAVLFGVGFFYFLVSIVRTAPASALHARCAAWATHPIVWVCADGQVPGTFLTVLEALGFKADRDKGMLMLHTVHTHGGVRAPIAALILLANYLFIPRALTNVKALLGHAGPICRESMLKYPYVPVQSRRVHLSAWPCEHCEDGCRRLIGCQGKLFVCAFVRVCVCVCACCVRVCACLCVTRSLLGWVGVIGTARCSC